MFPFVPPGNTRKRRDLEGYIGNKGINFVIISLNFFFNSPNSEF